jgi:hypothetical protein
MQMKPRDAEFLKRWETARAHGRRRHILVFGVLAWGLPMFIAMTFFVNPPDHPTGKLVLFSAVIWFLGGILFGALTWYIAERRYHRLTSQQPGGNAQG